MSRRARPRAKFQPAKRQSVAPTESLARRLEREQARRKQLEKSLKESQAQQTAAGEILGIISSSPTDIQPVLDAIVRSSHRIFRADASIALTDGTSLWVCAHEGPISPEGERRPVTRGSGFGRAILERRTLHIEDLLSAKAFPVGRVIARTLGFRTVLLIPLMKDGLPLGVLALRRTKVKPFTEQEIRQLQGFADQAVIALENVRLFTELEARNRELTTALDQQTATGDILRIISRSGTDVQPVFDAIADSALRLLRGWGCLIARFDGQLLHAAAVRGGPPGSDDVLRQAFPMPAGREYFIGVVVRDREVKQIADVETEDVAPVLRAQARARGWRANLAVPMLQDGQAIGAITVTRVEPGAFSPQEVELLKTFASQAVIAIENARLLTQLQQRTQDLTRSVDQLTALGDVGRAVSSSLDLDTVLTTIVTRANDLCATDGAGIYDFDDAAGEFRLRAAKNFSPELVDAARTAPLRRGEGIMGRLADTREPIQIADITVEGAYRSRLREILIRNGYRALLSVPLLREDDVIGALTVGRKTAGTFAPDVVDLLRTFAAQSSLAIQNARLFREIEVKSHQLEAASQHKSEFLASMSHELRTPLNAIIGFSDVLLEGMFGETNDKQTEYLRDILASGQHLLSLINDILDLSKVEAGRMELELGDFDLSAAIDSALILMRERASRRGVTLERTVDDGVRAIRADERKVKQILLNLLSNAVKFTPEGGRIVARAGMADGLVQIAVTDTGVGIAPEDQDAVFEEFRQVGRTDRKAEGTGLGLALCRKFVELHGGRIWVKSQLREGSTFAFTLPVGHAGQASRLL
jgi:signal transduction histidine kinase